MKAGVLLDKAIDILAHDVCGSANLAFQFPEEDRQAIETTEAALARLYDKSLIDILPNEDFTGGFDDIWLGDDEALDTFICGEDYFQTRIIKYYLGEPGKVAFKLLTRIFDGDLSDVIIYP